MNTILQQQFRGKIIKNWKNFEGSVTFEKTKVRILEPNYDNPESDNFFQELLALC